MFSESDADKFATFQLSQPVLLSEIRAGTTTEENTTDVISVFPATDFDERKHRHSC